MNIFGVDINPENKFVKGSIITFLMFLGLMGAFLLILSTFNEINKYWIITWGEYIGILLVIIGSIFLIVLEYLYIEKIQEIVETLKFKIKSLFKGRVGK